MTALALGLAMFALQGTARAQSVRVTATVSPDTVAVGEPVTLTVRVFAPEGARIVFPTAVDSGAVVEPLDPVVVRSAEPGDDARLVATYRLLAWRPGRTSVPLADIAYEDQAGARTLPVPPATLVVTTVLPADTALRVPKAAREIILAPRSRILLYALIAAALALVAIAVWLVRRRRRRAPPGLDPYADAQRAFGRLTALDLIGAGEPARHVTTSVEIVREFLAARNPRASRGLTTRELVAVVSDDPAVPVRRVESLFAQADIVKFAPESADSRTAETLGAEAEAIVRETYRLSRQQAGAAA